MSVDANAVININISECDEHQKGVCVEWVGRWFVGWLLEFNILATYKVISVTVHTHGDFKVLPPGAVAESVAHGSCMSEIGREVAFPCRSNQ